MGIADITFDHVRRHPCICGQRDLEERAGLGLPPADDVTPPTSAARSSSPRESVFVRAASRFGYDVRSVIDAQAAAHDFRVWDLVWQLTETDR